MGASGRGRRAGVQAGVGGGGGEGGSANQRYHGLSSTDKSKKQQQKTVPHKSGRRR